MPKTVCKRLVWQAMKAITLPEGGGLRVKVLDPWVLFRVNLGDKEYERCLPLDTILKSKHPIGLMTQTMEFALNTLVRSGKK